MSGCRECLKRQSQLTQAKADLGRIARRLSGRPDNARLQTLLGHAREASAHAQERFDEPHECDQLLLTEHWTRRGARV